MPCLVQYVQPGIRPEDYEAMRKIVDWEANPPPGGLLHAVWFRDDAVHEIDVWETHEAFADFTRDRFEPALARAGFRTDPPQVVELYNLAAFEGLGRFATRGATTVDA
jgi:hypothetical protein